MTRVIFFLQLKHQSLLWQPPVKWTKLNYNSCLNWLVEWEQVQMPVKRLIYRLFYWKRKNNLIYVLNEWQAVNHFLYFHRNCSTLRNLHDGPECSDKKGLTFARLEFIHSFTTDSLSAGHYCLYIEWQRTSSGPYGTGNVLESVTTARCHSLSTNIFRILTFVLWF